MDVKIAYRRPLYCDQGPNAGKMRVDLQGSVYLDAEEMEKYNKVRHFIIVIPEPADPEG